MDLENADQLYDLSRDPAEAQNRWSGEPEVVARLRSLLDDSRKQPRS